MRLTFALFVAIIACNLNAAAADQLNASERSASELVDELFKSYETFMAAPFPATSRISQAKTEWLATVSFWLTAAARNPSYGEELFAPAHIGHSYPRDEAVLQMLEKLLRIIRDFPESGVYLENVTKITAFIEKSTVLNQSRVNAYFQGKCPLVRAGSHAGAGCRR